MDAKVDTDRMVDKYDGNTADLEQELEWLARVANWRMSDYFDQKPKKSDFNDVKEPPLLTNEKSSYAGFVLDQQLATEDRLLLILALTPYIRPQLLDVFWSKNSDIGRGFTEFGGLVGTSHGGFIPTLETALFLMAGDCLSDRLRFMQRLEIDNPLVDQGILQIVPVGPQEPWTSGSLQISREFVNQIICGASYRPSYGVNFPARRVRTVLNWEQLILPSGTLEQLDEIRNWIVHGETLLSEWEMRDKLAPGFTSLFHGPPGTGKTLSASLLAKYCKRDVYKVDLSLMVSKYIGETEKNLAVIFDAAEHKNWILFFDEADALFGKRTKVADAHDRYANQEISFLLQRIEEFAGVVILASNFKTNIDDAFIRRFQSVIQFAIPKTAERLKIWRNAFSPRAELEPGLKLSKIAEKYEVSGGTIMNVVRFASLRSVSRGSRVLLREDVEEGLRREQIKEGRNL
jgi:hypothetical protein